MVEITRKEFDDLSAEVKNLRKMAMEGGVKKPKKPKRPPSKYNIFVGEQIKELRLKNPDKEHKVIFGLAVAAWNEQKKKDA